ncbi:MAG: phosphoribosylglycinamide formyltransferase [Candidatus Micrarchaeia archaeon]
MDKNSMRKEMIAKREARHSEGKGHMLCVEIMDRFVRLPDFEKAKCILLYSAIKGEVHTDFIIQSALSLGKRVAMPATRKESHSLELYEIKDMGDLSPGAFGIPEPQALPERRVQPSEVDLAVVPGVCFDRRGFRIGYGMGYYDKLLKEVPGRKIGLAYSFQVMDSVPAEIHDVAMDAVLTENGELECNGAAAGFRVAVLASGRGSDFQSIVDAVKSGSLRADIVGLITDNPEAKAIQRAKLAGVPSFVVQHATREELDEGVLARLDMLKPDLVVLAGYMKIIRSKSLLSRYAGRIINIHPSLLPKYPGATAQKDAFQAGEKVSGFTIHFVDESLDGGRIIYQEKVDISGCKSADEAAERILAREHVGLPMVVGRFAKGEIPQ